LTFIFLQVKRKIFIYTRGKFAAIMHRVLVVNNHADKTLSFSWRRWGSSDLCPFDQDEFDKWLDFYEVHWHFNFADHFFPLKDNMQSFFCCELFCKSLINGTSPYYRQWLYRNSLSNVFIFKLLIWVTSQRVKKPGKERKKAKVEKNQAEASPREAKPRKLQVVVLLAILLSNKKNY
jgi:hypothetical protein